MTGVILDLEPGGLRELHWHPNADEWQYVVTANYSVSLFGSHGRYRIETLGKGEWAIFRKATVTRLKTSASKAGRVLIGLNTGSTRRSICHNGLPAIAVLFARRSLPQTAGVFEQFPKERAFISPPDGQGRREIE